MFGSLPTSQKTLKWILTGSAAAAAVAATRLYYVQEMLAALLLFAVVFSCVAGALLVLFLLDRAGEAVLGFLESRGKALLQYAWGRRAFFEHRYRI